MWEAGGRGEAVRSIARPHTRLGVSLPDPMAVASPVNAARMVGELADAIAYSHDMSEVLVQGGWWGRRVCRYVKGVECNPNATRRDLEEADEVVEAIVDGSRPSPVDAIGRIITYYIDTRRSSILFLGYGRPQKIVA